MVRPKDSKGRVAEEAEAEASSHREATSRQQSKHQNKVLAYFSYACYYAANEATDSPIFVQFLEEPGQRAYTSR